MARSAQTETSRIRIVLRQRDFTDHEGRRVTLCWWSTDPSETAPSEETKVHFQVYSTVPLDQDLTQLVSYVDSGFNHWPAPAYEVYAEQPDVYSCVEHQRREIAFRKAREETNAQVLPPVPKVATDAHDGRRQGFLIVIASNSYRDASVRGQPVDPAGPLWATFDRRFASSIRVDLAARLEVDPDVARQIGVGIEEIEVLPEQADLTIQRIQDLDSMLNTLHMRHLKSLKKDGQPDRGIDENEGQPTDTFKSAGVQSTLEKLADGLSPAQFQFSAESDDIVTVSSIASSSEPDLRYIIHVPFLHGLESEFELHTIAKAFTAVVKSYLPDNKTVHFEFRKPRESTLSSIISVHRHLTQTRPDMTIGALHSIPDQPGASDSLRRVSPYTRRDRYPFYPDIEPYKVFAVVLDRPNFIEESGVLYVMTDGGKLNPQPGDPFHIQGGPNSDYFETQVWRSASMKEVARRLGMLVLDETKEQPALA